MQKFNVTICRCGKAKMCGEWVELNDEEARRIQRGKDKINFVHDTCTDCQNGIEPLS